MHPTIVDFGPFALHSYGLMMTIAFIVGIWLAGRRARAARLPERFAFDISFVIIVVSLICARLTYVVTHWDEFVDHLFDIISPIQHDGSIGIAGLVLVGGVIGGVIAAYAYARAKKLPLSLVFDVLTPSLVIGIAIGRIGCFLNGCCFGFPTDLPWGCVFPENSLAGSVYPHTPVHPTQLYEMALMFILFVALLRFDRIPHPHGRTFALFLMAYGVARVWVEGLRWYEADKIAGYIGSFRLTGSQIVSALMFFAGLFLWSYVAKKKTPEPKRAT